MTKPEFENELALIVSNAEGIIAPSDVRTLKDYIMVITPTCGSGAYESALSIARGFVESAVL